MESFVHYVISYDEVLALQFLWSADQKECRLPLEGSRAFGAWILSQIRHWQVCPNYLWIRRTALVVKIPDCQEPEKSGILNILMTSENQVLTLSLLDRQKPARLLFYSV